jgi:NADH-quinone oxidoreductase subunit M
MMLIPKAEEQPTRCVALVTSLAPPPSASLLLADFDYDNGPGAAVLRRQEWIDVINSRYIVGIDGMSLPLIALTLLIVPLVIIYSWNHFPEPTTPRRSSSSSWCCRPA